MNPRQACTLPSNADGIECPAPSRASVHDDGTSRREECLLQRNRGKTIEIDDHELPNLKPQISRNIGLKRRSCQAPHGTMARNKPLPTSSGFGRSGGGRTKAKMMLEAPITTTITITTTRTILKPRRTKAGRHESDESGGEAVQDFDTLSNAPRVG
ncbi:uncharacterized protein B0I36DRAFT_330001 [Microdochium trichocladiopsis]|uniref:Uncharacterized protein n=1 Tax=Microdochium trichocladiopsis TaxID=1682393 RepID=A0A9P9BMC9_9PEZI|nr:uncharacterized protein B0I36DRAFT_330001 [Microdochium trichocladiopsis]KAH7026155.1 hypothetical protein B0I36DRAFT_330001 [Microdochium trichocladiopsis]